MSVAIQPVQAANPQEQAHAAQAAQQAKPAAAAPAPQDKVTISESAKQALADNTKRTSGGDVDHDGDTH